LPAGLTRNARDFESLALRHAGEWRVISPEMRGRGDSAYAKDSSTYNPFQYVDDVNHLLDEAGIGATSRSGLRLAADDDDSRDERAGADRRRCCSTTSARARARGPGADRRLCRLGRSFPTWMHAARAIEETQGVAYPDTRSTIGWPWPSGMMVLSSNGRIVFDYDMKIAEPLQRAGRCDPCRPLARDRKPGGQAVTAAAWRAFLTSFGQGRSKQMVQALPGSEAVTLANVGHAPTLDETRRPSPRSSGCWRALG
jgi:pimeloyl-ACP methyl ester carboxylesterase